MLKLVVSSKFFSSHLISHSPHLNTTTTTTNTKIVVSSKKRDFSQPSANKFQLKIPANYKIIIQSGAVGVFALGFIDAGYSGDWSRIGAISRETEDLLKAAAFLVVPFCLFIIFSLSNHRAEE